MEYLKRKFSVPAGGSKITQTHWDEIFKTPDFGEGGGCTGATFCESLPESDLTVLRTEDILTCDEDEDDSQPGEDE
jgi:hypothetical protein